MLNYVDEEQNEFYFTSSTSEFLPGLMVFKETDYIVSYSSFIILFVQPDVDK